MIDHTKEIRKILGDIPHLAYMNLAVNLVNTRHDEDDTACAISNALIRHNGCTDIAFKAWASQYFTFSDDYTFDYRKVYDDIPRPKRGFCKKAYPNEEILRIAREVQKRSYGKKRIEFVKNSRLGLVKDSGHEIIRRERIKVDREALLAAKEKNTNKKIAPLFGIYLSLTEDGYMYEQYYEGKTGRKIAIGYSLQNAPRVIRKALLKGYYSYDFSTSQASLAYQATGSKMCLDYMSNKQNIRKAVMKELGVNENQVKSIITAVMYSASLEEREGNSLHDKFHTNLKASVWLQRWKKEWEWIYEQVKEGDKENWYSNLRSSAKQTAYYFQWIESRQLECLAEKYPIQALHHDGFVSAESLPVADLEEYVYQRTGWRVKIDSERL